MRAGVGVVMWVVVVWWACVVVGGTLATQPPSSANEAKDCVIYESREKATNPHRTFQRRVSLGIIPQTEHFSADLRLFSASANVSCSLKFVGASIAAASCEGGDGQESWTFSLPIGIFLAKDTTEFWLQVGADDGDGGGDGGGAGGGSGGGGVGGGDGAGGGGGSGGVGVNGAGGEGDGASGDSSEGSSSSSSSSSPNTDLLLVERRGGARGHLLHPSTGLLPPLTIHLQGFQTNHYFNCVTGCLYGKTIRTQPGDDTIYLHPESTFLSLILNYDSEHGPRSLNLTSDDLGVGAGSEGVVSVTVVWDSQAGIIGALVDGAPTEGLGKYNFLTKQQVIEAQVFGGGLLTECQGVFRRVAGGGEGRGATDEGDDEEDEEGAEEDGEAGNNSTSSSSTSTSTPLCDPNIRLVLGILLFVILVLFITICFVVLNHRARGNHDFPRVPSFRGSKHKRKDSAKASKTEEDYQGSSSDVTAALSETMTTDIPSPGSLSLPRPSKIVASKEFISLEL